MTKHVILDRLDNLIEELVDLKEYVKWQKDSPQCPPNDVKKSPNEAQNASTTSNVPTNTIPLQVPKQHKNATLVVEENQLTKGVDIFYTYTNQEGKEVRHQIFWSSTYFQPYYYPYYLPTTITY